jgi:hypothetical protein
MADKLQGEFIIIMKKKFIYLLLFCGSIIVTLFFTQCREDELETEPVTFGIKKEKIEYLRGEKALKVFQKIEKIAETSNKFRFLNKNGSHAKTANQGSIDYSEIMQVSDNQGNTNYTLRVLNHPNDNATTFHNVVVNMEDPNNQKVILMRLSNTNFQLQTVSSNATVTYTSLLDNPCPPITIPIEDPNNPPNGNGGGPGGGNSGNNGNSNGSSGNSGSSGSTSGGEEVAESATFSCNTCNFFASSWDEYKSHKDDNGNIYDFNITIHRTSTNSSSQMSLDPCLPYGITGLLLEYSHLIVQDVQDLLENNPFAMLNIPCTQLQYWQTIAQHQVPPFVKGKIENIDAQTGLFTSAGIQTLNDANNGAVVNMDFFPVTISQMPKKPNGQTYTQKELFDHIRTNINDFFDDLTFTPIVDSDYNINDTPLWLSNNPIGAILKINISGNPGSVVCSKYNSTTGEWYFTTITDPWTYNHPVSGNRAFGYYTDVNGNMVVYTRGVDRLTHGTYMYGPRGVAAEMAQQAIAFSQADEKWTNFQNKIKNFVNTGQSSNNNGQSTVNVPLKFRPNWNKVKEVLNGTRPISDLGCD